MSAIDDKDELEYRPRRFRPDDPADQPADEPAEVTTDEVKSAEGSAPSREDKPASQDSGMDYIVPEESYREHHRRHHHHHHHHSSSGSEQHTKKASEDHEEQVTEGYVFEGHRKRSRFHRRHRHHHHHSRKKLRGWKKALVVFVSVILALIVALGGTYLIMNEIGRSKMHNYDNFSVVAPTEDESGNDVVALDSNGRVINYNGASYSFNDDLLVLTFIGIDPGSNEFEGLYMSDAIYILTIDVKTGKAKILSISRDTMGDVDIYSGEGMYIDTEHTQIAYSYAYNNEKVSGGQNTNKSISRLFYGLPAENYFAINLDALTTLNDAIGGVTLTSSMTFVSPEDGRTIYEGEEVTLHGKEAERYVRYRDTSELTSNNDRMKRQQEYIRAFLGSIIPAAKKDLSVVTELYDAITSNSDSSLDISKLTYMASVVVSKLGSASDVEYVNLRGEITAGEHPEMNLTNEETITAMLDVFYKPIAKTPSRVKATEATASTAAEETQSE